jgi:N-acyl-D-amino-acid deacylase
MHDLVIRNALLLDGLGSLPVRKDLAVKGGIISEIGDSLTGKQIVDADGLALMPGIITTTHRSPGTRTSHPRPRSALLQR